jgi:hypothetical protein
MTPIAATNLGYDAKAIAGATYSVMVYWRLPPPRRPR